MANDTDANSVPLLLESDISAIRGAGDFWREFGAESRRLWYLAGPAICMSVSQYSLGAVTQMIAGQVGTLTLAAVTVENSVIAGFSFGILIGMGSAVETLCGQAYGAGQLDMLGVYMQRSWVILLATAVIISPLYLFATPILRLIGQESSVASAAGTFALWMLPQLFAYAANFPIAKFLQAQSLVWVMTVISVVVLALHAFLSWLLALKLGWGAPALAIMLNASWWLIVLLQLAYIFAGSCGAAWSGFSCMAFRNLWAFFRLSLASALMLCLEVWYFMALVLFAGYLSNPKISIDALSICTNIIGWAIMVALGFNAAISVRVSNELGARHPRKAKFSVVVVSISSLMIGLIMSLILVFTRNQYPDAFTNNKIVKEVVRQLTPLLAISIIANNIQPVLSGVAIGAGWQALVAYVNIGCYYLLGIPSGLILGFALKIGITGIWCGMLFGTLLQTAILFGLTYKTNWEKEASIAEDRIKHWGGSSSNGNQEV